MPRIVEEVYYDGPKERIERLGITPLIDGIESIIASFALLVEETVDANGGAAVRRLLDAQFRDKGGRADTWTSTPTQT